MTVLADNFSADEIDEMIEPICFLADMDTANEDAGREPDLALDALILAARKLRDREGFLVTEGDDDINAVISVPSPLETHHKDCDWHCDQYPWECTCGALAVSRPAQNSEAK